MFEKFPLWRSLQIAAFTLLFTLESVGQTPQLLIQSIPTGQKPLGITVVGVVSRTVWAVVANSGDNSVSVFEIKQDPSDQKFAIIASSALIPGIPSPYAVVACFGNEAIVTSPSANSISRIDPVKGNVVATVRVGSQPYSAACSGAGVLVSNYGDNSLSVIDFNSFTVTKTIPNVPGSRGLHGIAVTTDSGGPPIAWVAGADANVVTLVNLDTSTILTSLPVRGPTAVNFDLASGLVFVASSPDNRIISFSRFTLTIASTVPGVPTPQDLISNPFFRQVASTGPGNSIAGIDDRTNVTLIPGIPGATGLAGGFFSDYSPLSRQVAPFILATSPDSNRVFLLQAPPSLPRQFSVANGASFTTAQVAAGALSSLFAATGVSQNFTATSLPLPRTLGGVSLRFGGSLDFNAASGNWTYSPVGSIEAPLLFVGPNQINFQIPPGIGPGDSVPAQLTRPDGTALLTTLRVTATAPGIFTILQNGLGQAAALNQDNSLNFGTRPARRGSVIQIFATGAGETDPPLLPGEAASASGNPLVFTRAQPTVTIGGQVARVLFSGMAPGFVGLWQINAEVPANVISGPAVPLVITAGGVNSNTTTIAVE